MCRGLSEKRHRCVWPPVFPSCRTCTLTYPEYVQHVMAVVDNAHGSQRITKDGLLNSPNYFPGSGVPTANSHRNMAPGSAMATRTRRLARAHPPTSTALARVRRLNERVLHD